MNLTISKRKIKTFIAISSSLLLPLLLLIFKEAIKRPEKPIGFPICILDIINFFVLKDCQKSIKPIYAVSINSSDSKFDLDSKLLNLNLPKTTAIIPELELLETNFKLYQNEVIEAVEHRRKMGNIPRMDHVYNEIFFKGGKGKDDNDDNTVVDDVSSTSIKDSIITGVQKIATEVIYGSDENVFSDIGSVNWKVINLIIFDQVVPQNKKLCPNLVEALLKVPGLQSALISIMEPGARVPPHKDPGKNVVRYHICFKAPKKRENCFIKIDDVHQFHWSESSSIIFEVTYNHSVINDTDEERIILFVDILRPLNGYLAKTCSHIANMANWYYPGVTKLIKES